MAHDDHDANSRMSDIPQQLPASAKCSVEHFCIGNVLTDWERLPMHSVHSLQPIKNQTGVKSFCMNSIPVHTVRVYQQFLGLKKLFIWLHNEHEKL